MAIDSIASSSSAGNPVTAPKTKLRNDFTTLASDLKSGNLGGAKNDFATLLQDAPQLQTGTPTATTATASPTSAFSTLSAALQAGDLTGAQNAMATLQQSVRGHHHHHRHQCDQDGANQATGASQSPSPSIATVATEPTAA